MRFYNLIVTGPNNGPTTTYSSLANGKFNPGALDIELDLWAFNYATAAGGGMDVKSYARIYGIPLQTVAQATDLNQGTIEIYGGMSPGLPLATAAANQQGLLVRGTIFPAFGNWIGTDMTLDLVLAPPTGSNTRPINITGNWKKGAQLSNAITAALTAAFPEQTINVNVSPKLVLNYDNPFVYGTLQQFAQYAKGISHKILGPPPNYAGVNIVVAGNAINVFDNSMAPPTIKQIKYQDMIGQPTWLGIQTNFNTVLRADIAVGDTVQLPPAIQINTPQSAIIAKNRLSFAGQYIVQSVRHVGRFRQPDAGSWVTVFQAVPAQPIPD